MRTKHTFEMPQPILVVRGDFGDGVVDLVADKLAVIARHTREPVLSVRVWLRRNPDPAVAQPVVVYANVDVNGRLLQASAAERTLRDAVDRLVARLVRQVDDGQDKRRPHHR